MLMGCRLRAPGLIALTTVLAAWLGLPVSPLLTRGRHASARKTRRWENAIHRHVEYKWQGSEETATTRRARHGRSNDEFMNTGVTNGEQGGLRRRLVPSTIWASFIKVASLEGVKYTVLASRFQPTGCQSPFGDFHT
ncbi:hypothetical protein EV126DRAFT_422982 [Verticillium dahliae]|nr:hypothetical protein EV126DRAFT_422982 [Verticillium dahliae]